MPALFKGLQILSFFGAMSSVPFIPSLTDGNVTAPTVNPVSAGGGEEEAPKPAAILEPQPLPKPVAPPKRQENQGQQVMQQAMEDMAAEKGKGALGTAGLGCFLIPDFPVDLFFCFDKGELGSAPFLYHYLWGRQKGTESRLQKVESITRGVTAKLKKGSPRPLQGRSKVLLNWVSKWQDSSPFSPSEHCKIMQKQNQDYEVICSLPSTSNKGKEFEWKREISSKNIVEPENNAEIKSVSE